MSVLLLPTILLHVAMPLKFVAGPAINNAIAAPGEPNTEAIINATGIDAVAHI